MTETWNCLTCDGEMRITTMRCPHCGADANKLPTADDEMHARPMPELEVLRGMIRSVIANYNNPLTWDSAELAAFRRYIEALAALPHEQKYDECLKLAQLDKQELLCVLSWLIGVNEPDRENCDDEAGHDPDRRQPLHRRRPPGAARALSTRW
jgi:hypothetical protein